MELLSSKYQLLESLHWKAFKHCSAKIIICCHPVWCKTNSGLTVVQMPTVMMLMDGALPMFTIVDVKMAMRIGQLILAAVIWMNVATKPMLGVPTPVMLGLINIVKTLLVATLARDVLTQVNISFLFPIVVCNN